MKTEDLATTGHRLGLLTCRVCGQLASLSSHPAPDARCPRCTSPLRTQRQESLTQTAACLLAAAILYIPANLLPVMHTSSILGKQEDTILSGVLLLLNTGSWPLAALVFLASIFVPMLKLLSLAMLVVTAWKGSDWARLQRTRLYRLVEAVGRWSMLDIYVITVLVALVQFRSLAAISPGSGALAFAAVVVLTMLATQSFDSRLIWRRGGSDRD